MKPPFSYCCPEEKHVLHVLFFAAHDINLQEMKMSTPPAGAQSRRAALGLMGAGILGTANPSPSSANLFGKEPYKMEGSGLVFEPIPPPVYGSYYGTNKGNTAGNTYEGIKPTAGETFVYLPWFTPKSSGKKVVAAAPAAAPAAE
jgi:hypothetical protein